ncbi:hypothetical protein X777_05446, partial [Ooceraea biroi]
SVTRGIPDVVVGSLPLTARGSIGCTWPLAYARRTRWSVPRRAWDDPSMIDRGTRANRPQPHLEIARIFEIQMTKREYDVETLCPSLRQKIAEIALHFVRYWDTLQRDFYHICMDNTVAAPRPRFITATVYLDPNDLNS